MKKAIAIISAILVIAAAVKITLLNKDAQRPEIEYYDMGQTVEIGDNYFEMHDENMNGYSVSVLSVEILKTDDFLKKHNIDKSSLKTDPNMPEEMKYVPNCIYDLELKIKNSGSNNAKGISLYNMVLVANDKILKVDDKLWAAMYPHVAGVIGIALKENTEEIIHFPYAVTYSDHINSFVTDDMIYNEKFELILSKYPIEKRIKIYE